MKTEHVIAFTIYYLKIVKEELANVDKLKQQRKIEYENRFFSKLFKLKYENSRGFYDRDDLDMLEWTELRNQEELVKLGDNAIYNQKVGIEFTPIPERFTEAFYRYCNTQLLK